MPDVANQSSLEPTASPPGRLKLALRVAWMRLRFVVAVAALFLVIVLWRQLGGYWDQALAWVSGSPAHEAGVSSDTEYFCPMCPGVLSAWPEKCPVCKMPLVRRALGEAQLLPEGVTARMQISPYRLQLGGIQNSTLGYLPLRHEIRAFGRLSRDEEGWLASAPVNPWDAPLIAGDQAGEALLAAAPADIRLKGRVEHVTRLASDQSAELVLRIETSAVTLVVDAPVEIIIRIPLANLEPFRSQPRDPPPLQDGEPRQYFVCPSHPGWIRAIAGQCPFDGLELDARALRDDQRLHWTCALHDGQRFPERGHDCPHCERGCHVPTVIDYAPPGEVLALPESAVIDNGRSRIVFLETMPGMFDGREVSLGANQGGYYPVLAGLSLGDRVATSGAFLLDAETRLNPALAATYFGAGSAPAAGESGSNVLSSDNNAQLRDDRLAGLKLTPDDLVVARRQRVCPITRLPLGSMGELVRVEVEGRPVFLCCEACRGKIRKESLSASPPPAVTEGPQP